MFEEKDAFLCKSDLLNLFLFSSLREPVYTQPRNHILNTLHLQSCSFDMSEEWWEDGINFLWEHHRFFIFLLIHFYSQE